jgi:sirohydrochlorin cobaltochelatase
MIRAAGARIREAVDAAGNQVALHDTLLVVVGRGASDPDANSNVAKVTRMLWEGFGFGWAETAYSGVTFPLVEPALEKAVRLGFRRVVVFPYFLFSGILVTRIYDGVDAVAARHPEIEFIKAPYLNDHPLVLETFADRVHEIRAGQNLMNCQMCKYREQVLGFESEVGLPQESHHHHVEGIGSGPAEGPAHVHANDAHGHAHDRHHVHGHHGHDHAHDHPRSHDHPHDHGHHHGPGAHGHSHDGHGHHPYPHADHPLGPVSLKRR